MTIEKNQEQVKDQYFNQNDLNLVLADIQKIENDEFSIDLDLVVKAWSQVERKNLFGKQNQKT